MSTSYDHTLKVWDVESGRELRTLAGHTDCGHGVALSEDGRLAISASADKTLKVWEVDSKGELRPAPRCGARARKGTICKAQLCEMDVAECTVEPALGRELLPDWTVRGEPNGNTAYIPQKDAVLSAVERPGGHSDQPTVSLTADRLASASRIRRTRLLSSGWDYCTVNADAGALLWYSTPLLHTRK